MDFNSLSCLTLAIYSRVAIIHSRHDYLTLTGEQTFRDGDDDDNA